MPDLLLITFGTMCATAMVVSFVASLRTRRLERELRQDPLTLAHNRRAFEDLVERGGIEDEVALIMVDLDRFKEVNDSYGHAAGDETLRRVAGVMRDLLGERVGDEGELYRFGGDEFAIVLRDRDADHAGSLLGELRERLEQQLQAHERVLRLSAGVATAPEHAREWGTLLSRADRALYQAKRSGRDRTVVYSSEQLDQEARRDPLRMLSVLAGALGAAVDARDAYTHAHSHNVADLAGYIARTMGMDETDIEEVHLGGLLHDVGKIGVSDRVLRKPGSLDPHEWEEVKTHCETGYRILNSIDGAERVREMVLYHHERPDGAGYPRGVAGEDIPIGARIISVADAFDSMTADRVYRKGMSPQEALGEIVRLRGTQFDERVVDAICELMLYDPQARTPESTEIGRLPLPQALPGEDERDEDGGLRVAA